MRATRCALNVVAFLVGVIAADYAHAQALDIDGYDFSAGERELKSVNLFNRRLIDAPHSSHEISGSYAPFDRLKLALHVDVEQLSSGEWIADHGAFELQLKLLDTGAADGLSVGWFSSIQLSTNSDTTNSIVFGPIAKLKARAVTLTVNTYLEDAFGQNRNPGLALLYGWQARTDIGERQAIGIEGYGRVDSISNASSFDAQDHRIGPAFYYAFSPEQSFGTGVGIEAAALFGLTDATPATSFKISASTTF